MHASIKHQIRCDSSYASCPNDIDTDAKLQEGTTARVDFVTSCSDNIDTGIQASCNATSQNEFPVGVTTVTCFCEDLSENTDGCSFTVTVKDVTEPNATCPGDITTDATEESKTTARVTFVASCPDNIEMGIQPNCNATSNQTMFSVGVTTVTCLCEDASQNINDCSFNVIVKGYCYEDRYDHTPDMRLQFQKTEVNENKGSNEKCPSGKPRALRNCSLSVDGKAIWSNPVLMECFEKANNTKTLVQNTLKGLLKTSNVTTENAGFVAEDLETTINVVGKDTTSLTKEVIVDVVNVFETLSKVVNQTQNVTKSVINTIDKFVYILDNTEEQVPQTSTKPSTDKLLLALEAQVMALGANGGNFSKSGEMFDICVTHISPTLELTFPSVNEEQVDNSGQVEIKDEEKSKVSASIELPQEILDDYFKETWIRLFETKVGRGDCRLSVDLQGRGYGRIGKEISKKHGLTIFSQIGCAVSVFSLAVTILTFLSIKKLRSSRPQQIILQICIALLGLDIFFLVGIDRTELALACDIVAALIHFFCLASVAWMSTEATYMYLLFVQVSSGNDRYFMQKASVIGWGLPAVIVTTNVLLEVEKHEEHYKWNHSYISTCQYCFLDNKSNGFRFGLVAVLAVFLTYNLLLFIMIAWKLSCGRKRLKSSSATRRQQVVRRMQNVSAISILLGITWISGFLSIGPFQLVSNIIFCVSNSLQGFFIFLLFCVRQKDIRSAWKNSILARPLTTSLHRKTSRRPFKLSKHIKVESQAQATDGSSEMTRLAKRNTYEDFTTTRAMLSGNEDVDCAAAALASCAIMEPTSSNFVSVQQSPDFICHSPSIATSKGQVGQLIDIDIDSTEKGLDLSPPSPLGTNETPYPGPLTVVPPKESPSFDRGPPSPIGTMETPYSGPLIVVPPKESLSFDRGPPSPFGTMETPYSGPLTVVPPKESPSSDRVPPSPLGTMETPYSGPLIVVPPQESPSFDRVSTSSDAKHTTENPYAMFIAATNTGGTLSTAKVIYEGDNSPLLGPPIKNKDYN
ncbi:putative G-protein coupled receptor [Apostichopus japonicus]|uniref:Putative G-protein coupled receptor n=1 Tax=Stichopus japonicus TaxID=307972 RepID=A0A2G8KH25_STIJA|nr:putative G-protein coupled receptor [Apostichopus japonicus]